MDRKLRPLAGWRTIGKPLPPFLVHPAKSLSSLGSMPRDYIILAPANWPFLHSVPGLRASCLRRFSTALSGFHRSRWPVGRLALAYCAKGSTAELDACQGRLHGVGRLRGDRLVVPVSILERRATRPCCQIVAVSRAGILAYRGRFRNSRRQSNRACRRDRHNVVTRSFVAWTRPSWH